MQEENNRYKQSVLNDDFDQRKQKSKGEVGKSLQVVENNVSNTKVGNTNSKAMGHPYRDHR